jgi:hypothetical protein
MACGATNNQQWKKYGENINQAKKERKKSKKSVTAGREEKKRIAYSFAMIASNDGVRS